MTDPEEMINRERAAQLEFAWNAHTAQEAWTAKVDVKASILLAAQVGLLVAIATLVATSGFEPADGWMQWILPLGVSVILGSSVVAAAAIYPLLKSESGHSSDLIYFGHVRGLKPEVVLERLEGLSTGDQLAALSRQLVAMSDVNWRKHRRLQLSILLTGVGATLAVMGLCLSY